MIVKDFLHLQEALAAVIVLSSLLILLIAGVHDLGSSAGELGHCNLL